MLRYFYIKGNFFLKKSVIINMLTRIQCKKLGIPYVDLASEKNKIEFFADSLNQQIGIIKSSLPVITSPPEGAIFEGPAGRIAMDNEYFYICTENDTWKRIKLNEL